MILRIFRARVQSGKQDEYERLVKEQSIPGLQKQKGLISFFPEAPFKRGDTEYTMVTLWKDLESLKAFVGNDLKPILTPDEVPLVEEMSAEHYDYVDYK